MATTRLEYTGDGNTVTFSLGTIDLINRSDLKVYIFEPTRDSNTAVLQAEATNAGIAGTSHSQYDASNTSGTNAGSIRSDTPVNNYQFNSGNTQITLNTDNGVAKPTSDAIITLERITSELQSDFSSQGTIRASELNSELRRIQHIAEEGVNEAKLSIKESKFSANAVDVAHPTLGTDRRIEHVADADSDDDAVNREQLRKVIFDDLIEGEGINLTDATGGTNSNGQTTISGEDSSKTNKGIVTINEGEAIDVNYTDGNAVISAENSTQTNKGVLTVNSGHGIKVGPSDENDAGYDGNVIISAKRSTSSTQGIIQVNQVSGDAINVSHAVGGTVGDVTIGVDRSTTSQQGVIKVQSSVPITTTYTSDGEVSLAINDNTIDLAKIRNDDVITSTELNASTATSNYPSVDWDSDDSIATGKALAKRFDAIYYSHTTNKGTAPTETNWTEGKLWYDHLNDQTLSIWDKSGANTGIWRPITSGGTFTSQPKVVYVDSVNGSDINDGHRIIRAKKTIRGALLDVNENITSTTTTNVTAATYNHETGLLTVTTDANHNLRVGMKLTMSGLVWSCNYGGGTNNHTFPEADDPVRYVSSILSNTEFESQLEPTVTSGLAHTYVSGGTVTNQAGRVGQGWMITVAAGTYQEVLPLRVEAENVSIVGTTIRSCFIHPSNSQRYDTSKDFNASDAVVAGTSEYNTMFEMNSGTYIWGFAFSGLKAGGWTTSGGSTASARGAANGYVPEANRNEQRTNVDPDSTYGLPPVQGWVAAFRPNCSLKKSPYIQNCTSISDTDINNAGYDPTTTTGGLGGDKDSGMTGGGILVDGSTPSATSPLRSFVVDAFTQINMDGPGILCTNNGYAQLVSFFGTFCHYHAKSLNGGMLNLANCTTDYGRYGLIADGKSATTTFTSTVDGAKAAGQTSFNIDATTITSGYFGTGFNNTTTNLRPGDNYLVSIGSDTYEIVSATPVGGSWTATNGWTITIMKTNATNPAINDGLTNAITDGATVNFYQRSYISTGGHTFEYTGAGTDYRAAPENGGVPIEANEVINRNMGKVWQSSTNHVGKFKVGDTFVIDQRSGKVESKGITLTGPVTTNGNDNITIDPAGSGTVTIGSALAAGNTTVGTLGASGDVTFNTGNITTAGNANITLTPNGSGKVVIDALSWPIVDGTAGYVLNTDGSGNLGWTQVLPANNPTVSGNIVITDNLQLTDDDDSHSISITAPATVASNVVLTLPAGAPSANQYLKAGASTPTNLEWENQIAITTVQTAANESAMLGLTTQEGDVVIRSDQSKSYIKNAGTAGSMADFTELVSPTGGVTSWAGASGVITTQAAKDVIIGTGDTFVKLKNAGTASNTGSNTMAGSEAGNSFTTGSAENTLYGYRAGKGITSGTKNLAIGIEALEAGSMAGDNNVAVGKNTLQNYVGPENTAVGNFALKQTLYAGSGVNATGINNVAVGYQAARLNTSGKNIVAVGHNALYTHTAPSSYTSDHTAIGSHAAYLCTTGFRNTNIGAYAGYTATTGSLNTNIGFEAGWGNINQNANVNIGHYTGRQVTGGTNISIGAYTNNAAQSGSNNVIIGYNIMPSSSTVSNEITLGNTASTNFRVPGVNFSVSGTGLTCGGELRLGDSDNSHRVGFKAPSTVTADKIWTLPAADGGNGEVLKTDGSGNLSWGEGGGSGPEVTATASGTIADKGAVVVNSDGTVSAVASEATVTGSIVAESSGNGGNSTMAYDTANGKVLHVYIYSNNLYGRVGTTNTNGTLSWGSEVGIWTGSGSAGYPDIAFASDTGVFYLFYRRWTGNDSRGYLAKLTVSGTTFSTAQTTQVVPQDGPEHGCIALDNNGGGMLVWKSNISGENNRLKANVLTFGSNASSISAGSRQEVNTGNTANYPSVAYDPVNDNYCINWENNSMSGRFTSIKATVANSSSITFQGTNSINNVRSRETQTLNIGAGKFLGLWAQKDNDDVRGTIITMNADNTISYSTATIIYTSAGSGDVNMMNNNCLVKVDYLTDTYAVLMMDYGSSSKGVLQYFTASGSTITPTDTVQLWPNGLNNPALVYDSDKKLLVSAGRDANNNYYISSRIYRQAQSNADAGNFLGFASAGYSNGNTATIKVVGNTVTGLSGLTAGKKIYVQGNGTLGTTSTSVEAGISLTSSSLLIR